MSDLDGRSGGIVAQDGEAPAIRRGAAAARAAADLAPGDDAGFDAEPEPAAPAQRAGALRRRPAALLRRVLAVLGVAPQLPAGPRAQYGTALTPDRLVRGLSRHSRTLAMARLRCLPCFRAAEYVGMYGDLTAAQMDPHFHALFVGSFEERHLFKPESLARNLGLPAGPATSRPAALPRPARVALYVSSLGNAFMREIAGDIAANLRAAGAPVDLLDETAPIGRRPPYCIFVAPHEFFLLGRGVEWVRDDVVAASVMLNTEQAQTRWFGRALPFLLASRGVVELCPQTAALFAATGLPSLHLTPAPPQASDDLTEADLLHPLYRVLPAAARALPSPDTSFAARPIDLAFFGTESRHRENWLARNAGALAALECVIHYRREDRGPIRPGSPDGALTRLARHVGGHAKILLNLHRDAFGYLEWHRIVRQGFATGAVVVSEPCLPHPLLTPGVHYLEASSRQIPDLIAWLLHSEDGQRAAAQVQANARALLADTITPQATAARLLGFLHAHAGAA